MTVQSQHNEKEIQLAHYHALERRSPILSRSACSARSSKDLKPICGKLAIATGKPAAILHLNLPAVAKIWSRPRGHDH